MPRKHIRSYAAGLAADRVDEHSCPCNGGPDNVPTLVRRNWYCDSGIPTDQIMHEFFPNNVLWDSMNCTQLEPPCCTSPWLPYFHAKITRVTTGPIELRTCHDQGCDDENIPFEQESQVN